MKFVYGGSRVTREPRLMTRRHERIKFVLSRIVGSYNRSKTLDNKSFILENSSVLFEGVKRVARVAID